jgi:hypothetical protein
MNKEYFLLSQDKRYYMTPKLLGLFDILDKRDISRQGMHKLPKRMIVRAEVREEYDHLDLLDDGLFLVSDDVMTVFSFYEEDFPHKPVVLLCGKTVQMKYNLPIFEEVNCLHESSERNEYNKTVVRKIVLARDRLGSKSVFKIANTYYRHIIIRLDAAESLLRRKMRGLSFQEVEVK